MIRSVLCCAGDFGVLLPLELFRAWNFWGSFPSSWLDAPNIAAKLDLKIFFYFSLLLDNIIVD